MKAVIQRCHRGTVSVDGVIEGSIGPGLAVFLGVAKGDTLVDAERLARKIASLRIFNDAEGRFNLSVRDKGGAALVISNFTLYGDTRKGARPNFTAAAAPELAQELYEAFVTLLRAEIGRVETGVFAAAMDVTVENDGPMTMIIET